MSINSRQKGARGEREFRDLLRAHGFEARRDGRLDDDLDHSVPGVHFEVKRRESLRLDDWIAQSRRDADGRVPVVAWKKNRGPWRVDLDADFFLELVQLTNHQKEQEASDAGGDPQ